jgi:hypothetical protein
MQMTYNQKATTISGHLKISKAREDELDFLMWKMWTKDLPDQINGAMVLEKLIEIAETPAELAYVLWLGVNKYARMKNDSEGNGITKLLDLLKD